MTLLPARRTHRDSSTEPITDRDIEPLTVAPSMVTRISPLIAAGSRFPVGTGNPDEPAVLGPPAHRSFLLRGAERSPYRAAAKGGTPKTTSGYDGTKDDDSEEFNQPDFAP